MALDRQTEKRIEELVFSRPRSVQEVAEMLKRNWRTAESYLESISKDKGTISLHTFRGGTKGALKLAYWNSTDRPHANAVQERFFQQILAGRTKFDFSPFDIYQFVDESKKDAYLEEQREEVAKVKQDLITPLRGAKRQVLIFSGNLSWANITQDGMPIVDVFEEIARDGVQIKFLTNLNILAAKNWEKLDAVNRRLGRDAIEMRHAPHPLRAFIVDDGFAQLKETYAPQLKIADNGAKKDLFIFYCIRDPEWVSWMQKVFWHLFRTALPAQDRFRELKTIRGLRLL